MRLLTVLALTFCASLPFAALNRAQAEGVKMMPNYYYDINVVRPTDTANAKDGDFSIRLTSPGAMTGCYKINPANIEIVDAGAVIFVKLEEGDVELEKTTNYGQFGCEMTSGSQYIDIPFNKDKLAQNNTDKITISSKTIGKLFDIKVETSEHKVTLETELKTGVRLPDSKKKKIIDHWFYPDNTIIVFANNMDKNPDILKQVKVVAGNRGLTPMNIELKGFEPSDEKLFFIDTKNIFSDAFDEKSTISIGHVTTSEEYHGANGPYIKKSKQAVFARKPNSKD
ncbi:MAG: hypothetical protein GW778_01765 [Alphaproteobacteria bacterium]|nr:hypothetical protein [Alphaproteobacteria bacterium]